MTKVLILAGSPRRDANTRVLSEALAEARALGARLAAGGPPAGEEASAWPR